VLDPESPSSPPPTPDPAGQGGPEAAPAAAGRSPQRRRLRSDGRGGSPSAAASVLVRGRGRLRGRSPGRPRDLDRRPPSTAPRASTLVDPPQPDAVATEIPHATTDGDPIAIAQPGQGRDRSLRAALTALTALTARAGQARRLGRQRARDAEAALRSLPDRAREGARTLVAHMLERPLRLAVLPVAALCVAFSMAGTSGASGRSQTARASFAPPLFQGSQVPGRLGAEASAIELVQRLGGIALGETSPAQPLVDPAMATTGVCAASRLRVSWTPPVGPYRVGAFVDPLGPPPTVETKRVNGVVTCEASTFAYMGFEASWDGSRWQLNAVPDSAEDIKRPRSPLEDSAVGATPALPANPNPTVAVAPGTFAVPDAGWGAAIEPLAPYDPQTICDPTPKPGAVGLRNLLLHSFPGSRDLGIGQSCDTPDGVSEHKEGRAFDWGVNVDNPAEKAMADRFLTWLLAPDTHGNAFAMIRRLGIMYVIWDHHIWGSYRADDGWRPYEGVSPHTDHIHISLSWAGGLAQTSFWTGHVGDVSAVNPGGSAPSSGGRAPGNGTPQAGPSSPPPFTSRSGTAGTPSPTSPGAPGSPPPSSPGSPAPPGPSLGPAPAPGSPSPSSPPSSSPPPSSSSPPPSSSPSSTTTTTAPGPAPGVPPPTLPLPLPH